MGKGHSDGQYQAGVIAPIFHKFRSRIPSTQRVSSLGLCPIETVARDRATDSDCNETPRERLMKRARKVKKAKKVQKMGLGAIFDAHIRHEFVDHDVAATMKTMAAEPSSTTCPRSPAATVTPA